MKNSNKILELIKKQRDVEENLPGVVNKYISKVNPDLAEESFHNYKARLTEDISNYIEKTGVSCEEAQTDKSLAKISFERLVNASKRYFVENTINSDKASAYKIEAEALNQEYKALCSK